MHEGGPGGQGADRGVAGDLEEVRGAEAGQGRDLEERLMDDSRALTSCKRVKAARGPQSDSSSCAAVAAAPFPVCYFKY